MAAILGLYLALGWMYASQPPFFVKPDEGFHLAYVEYVKQTGQLPVMDISRGGQEGREPWEAEAHQPPLYYLLVAILTPSHAADNDGAIYEDNPHFLTTVEGNRNAAVAGPGASPTMYYAGRLVSLVFGLATAALTCAIALEFAPPAVALLAAALVAFNPQFLYISTSFSNDIAGVAFATLGLWLGMRMLQRGVTLRRGLLFGVAVGVGTLFKLSAFGLLVLLPFIAAHAIRRREAWPRGIGALALAGLVGILLPTPWFLYNLRAYGDPFATGALYAYMGVRHTPRALQEWGEAASFLWKGYWLDFSVGGLVYAPPLAYWAAAVLVVGGGLGAVWQAWRKPGWRWPLALLALWIAVILGGWVSLTARAAGLMGGGRLLFPAVAAIAGLLAAGWTVIVRPRGVAVVVAGLGVLAAVAVPLYIWPQTFDDTTLANVKVAVPSEPFRLEDQAAIVGYRIDPPDPTPGSIVNVYVAWQALRPFDDDLSVFVQVWDVSDPAQPQPVAQVDTYPGLGAYPTLNWPTATTIVDRYPVQLPDDLPPGWQGAVVVGMYSDATQQRLAMFQSATRQPFDAAIIGDVTVSAAPHAPNLAYPGE
ncbi:MAG: glycosyltransferase family 39 protein [Anaerolineae bacterium]